MRAFVSGALPADVTSLVGRRAEAEQVKRLLSGARLVTLVGTGGVGKTRLALQVAREVQRVFPDGVHWVSLADVGEPALLGLTVMEAVGLHTMGSDAATVLLDFLRDKQMLLVFDNCEHLVDGCAELAAALLSACPGVRVLATSREVLDIAGERVFLVAPLPLPEADGPSSAQGDSGLDAVTLFAERAAAAVPGFTLTPENRPVVAALCQHLDGLPLAIELAAVRMRVLTVEELLERQDERYEILTAKRRGPSPRHHSLRAMVDWSFELCTEQEQLLWARMSVFAGGCDLPAVEDICTDSVLSPDAVLDALTGLVEKSIAVREDSGGAVRYRMLETLRQYGLEHLRLGGDEAQVRRRHRDHYLRLADRIEQQWFGRDQVVLFGSAREEHPNLRAAMEYSLAEPGQATAAMHMAAALYSYWITCGLLQEGFHWLERALEGDPRRGLQRAEALWATGFLTLIGGNPKVLASSPTRRADDIAIKGGEMHVATSMLGECLEIAAELNSQEWTAHATYTLGFGILIGSQDPTGFSMLTDGIEMERQLGSSNPRLCFAQYMLAEALTLGGLTEQAIPIGEECLATCRAVGDEWLQSWIHLFLGLGRWIQEEHTQASAHLEDCIRLKQPFHELLGIAAAMEFLSWCAVAMGDAERGARLSGAVQVILKPLGAPPASFAPILGWREKVVLQAIAVLGESTYEQIYRSAMQFSADEAIAYALGTAGPHSAERPAGSESPLTPREEQVAEMIADGLSNKEISEQLVISQRTAETHAANILKKLGYVSRTQVAVWTTERRRQSPADRRPA